MKHEYERDGNPQKKRDVAGVTSFGRGRVGSYQIEKMPHVRKSFLHVPLRFLRFINRSL